MRHLKINELVELKFSVKHPFAGLEPIPVRANIRTLDGGGIEIVDMYYTDPRYPDEEVVYHHQNGLKLQLGPDTEEDEVEVEDNKQSDDDEVVDMAVKNYTYRNIINIMIKNGLCSHHVVLVLLGRYWHKHPELRLAQIVSNAWRIHPEYRQNPEPDIQDIFYLSDSKFLEGLELLTKDEPEDQGSTQG